MANVILTPIIIRCISDRKPSGSFADNGVFLIGVDASGNTYRSLLYFDIHVLLKDIEIERAFLKMYTKTEEGKNQNALITPFAALSDWNEYRVTWNNQPDIDPSTCGNTLEAYKEGWITWDVTEIIKAWTIGCIRNNGIVIRSSEAITNDCKRFVALNSYYSNRYSPKLEINYKFKNSFSLISRNTVSLLELFCTEETYKYTKWINCSIYSRYTYFVQNTGSEIAEIFVQVSPDKSAIVDEEKKYRIQPGETKILEPLRFSFFTRLTVISVNNGNHSTLKIWFQAQT